VVVVPDTTPALFNVNPAGNVPDTTKYVYGGFPPVTLEKRLKLTEFPSRIFTLVVDPGTAVRGTAVSITTFPVIATLPVKVTVIVFFCYAVYVNVLGVAGLAAV
jgi:hypothetical protein